MALRSERLREDTFEEMDWSKATYEPFDEVVRLEGGAQNVKNYEAAVNYCKWCIRKGGRWIKWMKRSKRLNYAYQKEGFGEELKRKFTERHTADIEEPAAHRIIQGGGTVEADAPEEKEAPEGAPEGAAEEEATPAKKRKKQSTVAEPPSGSLSSDGGSPGDVGGKGARKREAPDGKKCHE